MSDPSTNPTIHHSAQRDPVEELAEEFLQRRRQGERPTVAQYAERYPEWAERIRELFQTLLLIENLKPDGGKRETGAFCPRGADDALHQASDSPPSETSASCLGDYRIVREIGRGGMGVVYEAVQESLGRRVALKVVSGEYLRSANSLKRFEREAQAAARLHHTNIVPVFGVGRQGGKHYYVMQFIEGHSLDHVLHELSLRSGGPSGGKRAVDPPATDSSGSDSANVLLWGGIGGGAPKVDASHRLEHHKGSLAAGGTAEAASATGTSGRDDTAVDLATVAEALISRSGYWQGVARIGAQAAGALDYAHRQGTLHRDVKPGNLLADVHGNVWITDFGLAKLDERDDLTRPGDVVGTLRYMAPEMFDGRCDARSDVYSLGLTLYELLTLKPAFDETSRHRLVQQVVHEEPPPPRKWKPEIPRDLETIVLKAIARNPRDRYPSAGAMAEDLECFLDDRPVAARRTTPVERLWRWCRRNPVVAGLTSAVLVLLVLVTVVASAGYFQTKRAAAQVSEALDKVAEALEGETESRRKAEATSQLAVDVLDRIYEQLAPDRVVGTSEPALEDSEGERIDLPRQPVLSKETGTLLENMLVFYGRLAEQSGEDPQLREKVADANRRVGEIHWRLGDYERAVEAYQQSIDAYRALEDDSGGRAAYPVEIARASNELGRVHWAMQQFGEGRAAHRQALEILEPLSASSSSPPQRYELARTYYYLGKRHGPPPSGAGGSGPGPGRPGPPRGFGDRRFGPRESPAGPAGGRRGPSAIAPMAPGGMFGWGEREDYLDKAVELLEDLMEEDPADPAYRHLLALCHRDVPPVPPFQEQRSSVNPLERSVAILEELARDFPDVADYRYDLSETLAMVDVRPFALSSDSYDSAEARLRRALEISNELVSAHPNVPDYASSKTHIYFKLAELMRRASRREEGEACLREGLTFQTALVKRYPEVKPFKIWMTWFQLMLGKALRDRGELAEARSLLEESTAALNELLEDEPFGPFARGMAADHAATLADVLSRMGEDAQAEELRRRFPSPWGRPHGGRSGRGRG